MEFFRPGHQASFYGTRGYTVLINGKPQVLPYRVTFTNKYTQSGSIMHNCRQSRNSDGHMREAALKKLVACDLDTVAVAYVLIALGDYVLEINTLPLLATEKTKVEMRKIVRENPLLVHYLDAATISYWNEYYRSRYTQYTDYPAHAFLQKLKAR